MNNNFLKVKGATEYTSSLHKRLQNERKTQTIQPKTHKPKTWQTPWNNKAPKKPPKPSTLNSLKFAFPPPIGCTLCIIVYGALQVLNLPFTLYLPRSTHNLCLHCVRSPNYGWGWSHIYSLAWVSIFRNQPRNMWVDRGGRSRTWSFTHNYRLPRIKKASSESTYSQFVYPPVIESRRHCGKKDQVLWFWRPESVNIIDYKAYKLPFKG